MTVHGCQLFDLPCVVDCLCVDGSSSQLPWVKPGACWLNTNTVQHALVTHIASIVLEWTRGICQPGVTNSYARLWAAWNMSLYMSLPACPPGSVDEWESIWLSIGVVKAETAYPDGQAGFEPPEGAQPLCAHLDQM